MQQLNGLHSPSAQGAIVQAVCVDDKPLHADYALGNVDRSDYGSQGWVDVLEWTGAITGARGVG